MSPSKDANSRRRKSDPSIDTMGDEGLPKEICSRVRKACNRCRLRKVKCNGRIPCARCEQDHATCKINYEVTGIKDLRKSYIASLEEQQISLLSALRDLQRKMPHNSDVCDTIEQLQRKGFDIEALKFNDPHRDSQKEESPRESASPHTMSESGLWQSTQLTVEYLQSLLEHPVAPQVVSDPMWPYDDTAQQHETQHPPLAMRWQSADSFFGMTVPQNAHPIVDPLSGRFINPSTMPFGLEDSNMVLS